MRVLITGAAGKVGRAVRRELCAAGHTLRLMDIKPIDAPEGETVALDVAEGEAVRRAVRGMEAVVHLAYGSDRNDGSGADICLNYDVNAKGTYFLLWAAKEAGVRRLVYTSTLTVFGGTTFLARRGYDENTPPAPVNPYGLTKLMGEEVCRFFARRHGMSIVCLRLCGVKTDAEWADRQTWKPQPDWTKEFGVHRAMTTHVDDVARAIHLALTAPNIGFELLHIAADNTGRVTEIARAKEVLGFWPAHRLDDR